MLPEVSRTNMMLAGMLPLFWLKKISVSSAKAAVAAAVASSTPEITDQTLAIETRMADSL